ncbi:MAG: acyl carrier protein [Acidimicrobiia bacterium]
MNDEELHRIVRAVLSQVAPEANLETLDADVDLAEQIDIDSMDFLNFVIGLEEATGVDIPERDYAQLATLAGCVEYLRVHAAPR